MTGLPKEMMPQCYVMAFNGMLKDTFTYTVTLLIFKIVIS